MHDAERLAALALGLVRGVQPVEHADHDGGDDRRRDALAPARSRRGSAATSDSPCTYSMTRKSSPAVATTSSVGTTFGWRMRAARRASSRNIETNSGSSANCGCSRLMATVRAKPDRAEQPPEVDGRHAARRDLLVERVAAEHQGQRGVVVPHGCQNTMALDATPAKAVTAECQQTVRQRPRQQVAHRLGRMLRRREPPASSSRARDGPTLASEPPMRIVPFFRHVVLATLALPSSPAGAPRTPPRRTRVPRTQLPT